MRIDKLHELQGDFFARYPEGFMDPEMLKIGKKHNVDKVVEFTQTSFAETEFGKPESIIKSLTQVVSKSSMISMFDKPKFRDAVLTLSPKEREGLVDAVQALLYGNQQTGFEQMLEQLVTLKLGRWSLMSVLPFYFNPQQNWFIKPNTTKSILKLFEVDQDMVYKPRPSFAFYRDYSDFLTQLRDESDPRLSPNNAAFTGFLMMTIK